MNICFIITELGGGGAERVISLLTNELLRKGHRVIIACTSANAAKSYKVGDGVSTFFLSGDKKISVFKKVRLLRKILKQEQIQVIVSFLATSSVLACFAKFGLGISLISSERNSPVDSPSSKFMRYLRDFGFKHSSALVFQSEAAANYFAKKFKSKERAIIGNPIEFGLLPKASYDTKTIIAAGRLVNQKNYPCLLTAFEVFHSVHQEYKLRIFGNGKLLDELVHLRDSIGLHDCVDFIPYSTNIWQEMAKASIFAMSSLYEGMPNSLLEAEGLGLPIAATDFRPGIAKELIINGKNGEIAVNDDANDLARCLNKIADNYDWYKQNAIEHIVFVKTKYDVEVIAGKWVELFDKLAK